MTARIERGKQGTSEADATELVRLLSIYIPYGPAVAQALGDLERSKPADKDPALRELFGAMRRAALAQR